MRDKLKSSDYFNKKIDYTSMAIKKFEDEMKKREMFGSDKIVAKYALDKLFSEYSVGKPILEIKESSDKAIFNILGTWTLNDGLQSLMDALSLAILLGTPRKNIDLVKQIVKENELNDLIIDTQLKYLEEKWIITSVETIFPDRYQMLCDVINEPEESLKCEKLVEYLNSWYELNNESHWYDSHLNKYDLYVGYWCLEAGAIAKILQIDDSSLKNHQYYPYDMVHWND